MPTTKDNVARWLGVISLLAAVLSLAFQIYVTREIQRSRAKWNAACAWQHTTCGEDGSPSSPESLTAAERKRWLKGDFSYHESDSGRLPKGENAEGG